MNNLQKQALIRERERDIEEAYEHGDLSYLNMFDAAAPLPDMAGIADFEDAERRRNIESLNSSVLDEKED